MRSSGYAIVFAAALALSAAGPWGRSQRPGTPPAPAPGPARGRAEPAPQGGGRDAGVERAPAPESPADSYFAICDYNADGSIIFKEAQASLGLDRDGWLAYDTDSDGLIDRAEFKRRYESIVERGGAFPAPVPKDKGAHAPRRNVTEMLAAYDKDHDMALDLKEIARALADYRVTELAPEVALEKLDRDASRKLEPAEILELAAVLAPRKSGAPRAPAAKSIAELFGQARPRETRVDSTPLPAQIAGPVPSFRRLDLDGDGQISLSDLEDLQRPLQLSVRLSVLFSALDADGDGGIGEDELRRAMQPARP